jgi:hypothetical protein
MALEDLRVVARSWLLDLANCVWPEERIAFLADRVDTLKEEIRQGYDDLMRQRRRLERVQERVDEEEQLAVSIPWQVQAYIQLGNKAGAYRKALELDQVRAALQEDCGRLRQLDKAYRMQVAMLETERQRLGQMQLQLLRLRPVARAV